MLDVDLLLRYPLKNGGSCGKESMILPSSGEADLGEEQAEMLKMGREFGLTGVSLPLVLELGRTMPLTASIYRCSMA